MTSTSLKFAITTLRGAALLALLAAPVHAQSLMPGFQLGGDKEISEDEKERNRANEKAAKEAQRSIAAPKVSNDPWGDVRGAAVPAAKTGAKSKAGAQ